MTMFRRVILVCIALALLAGPAVSARGAQSSQYSPYCGVYSLYAAMKLEGKSVEMESLLQPQYVGSFEGSSLAELRDAAIAHGMYAEPMQNLTLSALRELKTPAILHVKASLEAPPPDHWILFVNAGEGDAHIIDGSRGAERIPVAKLAARWNGTALLVSAQPIEMSHFRRSAILELLAWSVGVLALMFCISLVRRYWPSRPTSVQGRAARSVAQCVLLLLGSSAAAWGHHALTSSGYLARPDLVAEVREAHWAAFLPRVTTSQVRTLLERGDAVLVDARLPADFERGHIQGAINVPVTLSLSQIREHMVAIPRERYLVLYCQSETCTFAKTVASRLAAEGYRRQSLFDGGWNEWVEAAQVTSSAGAL
jgi:rhodanese-related sulfurtransferase